MGLLQMAHDLPHILDRGGAGRVNGRRDGGGNLVLAKLGWQKSRDDLDLGLFGFGKFGTISSSRYIRADSVRCLIMVCIIDRISSSAMPS